MVECHYCPDRRLWDEIDIVYYRSQDGSVAQDSDPSVRMAPSLTKEPIPGAVPICPDCLTNPRRD